MSSKKQTFKEKFYINIAPVITGIGASVVILGALFKIQHYPGAGPMLIVGLGTEAILFLLFAFAPQFHDPDWTRVYPQLADDYEPEAADDKSKPGITKKLDDMLEKAKIDQTLVEKLGRGMNSLSESVNKIGELGNASVATAEYAKNVKAASGSMVDMNKAYGTTIQALTEISNATVDAKAYHAQVQGVTKNLGALNAVYELELKDANTHLKAMNKFYTNLSGAMENMAEASKDTANFKTELSKLTTNLTSLNSVYGNMLAAMRGPVAGAPAGK
ncbi:MAG: gliding motility protein GldL [Bacteroidota bacterium]